MRIEKMYHKFFSAVMDIPGTTIKRGDKLLVKGSSHYYVVVLASPTSKTVYNLNSVYSVFAFQVYIRPLFLHELLKMLPHLTKRILRVDVPFQIKQYGKYTGPVYNSFKEPQDAIDKANKYYMLHYKRHKIV